MDLEPKTKEAPEERYWSASSFFWFWSVLKNQAWHQGKTTEGGDAVGGGSTAGGVDEQGAGDARGIERPELDECDVGPRLSVFFTD